MTLDELAEEIMISLGANLVDVELSMDEIGLAFKKAKRTFQQKGHNNYRRVFYQLPVQPCRDVYMIPSEIDTVVKVIRPTTKYFSTDDEFSMAAYNQLFGSTNTGLSGDWLSYELTLQQIERLQKYTAFDVQFNHDIHRDSITFLKNPNRKEIWLLEVYTNLTDEEYMDVLWIQEWALAEAKIMLGNAYRKFSQLPSPDGSISLDGNGMIQEGNQDKERLLQEILDGVDGGVDYYEISFG